MATPTAQAKEWFRNNPKVRCVGHWRWNELSASSHEVLSSVRLVTVVGHRVCFEPFHSEMDLRSIEVVTVTGAECRMAFGPVQFITYRAEN